MRKTIIGEYNTVRNCENDGDIVCIGEYAVCETINNMLWEYGSDAIVRCTLELGDYGSLGTEVFSGSHSFGLSESTQNRVCQFIRRVCDQSGEYALTVSFGNYD